MRGARHQAGFLKPCRLVNSGPIQRLAGIGTLKQGRVPVMKGQKNGAIFQRHAFLKG